MTDGPDRWLTLTLPLPSDAHAPLLARALVAAGGRAIEERDGELVTHLPPPDDPEGFVEALSDHLERLLGETPPRISWGWHSTEAWEHLWKEGLAPRRVSERLTVAPTWSEVSPASGEVVIRIDPGIAFGTAEHASTRGCLRLMDELLEPGDRVLDVGTGSGILAIAALRLGAAWATAVDADPLACAQTRENAETNGVEDRIRVEERRVGPGDGLAGSWTGLLANLDTPTLVRLFPELVSRLEPCGWAVVGGIRSVEIEDVGAAAGDAGLREIGRDEEGGWSSLALRRDDGSGSPECSGAAPGGGGEPR